MEELQLGRSTNALIPDRVNRRSYFVDQSSRFIRDVAYALLHNVQFSTKPPWRLSFFFDKTFLAQQSISLGWTQSPGVLA
jgi:hypothetical protein